MVCVSVGPRGLFPSLNALTLTGARVGTTADDAVAFVMGVIDGLLDVPDLDVAGVVAAVETMDALEDFIVCD